MFEKRFSPAEILELRAILDNGEFAACRRAIRDRICRGCCENGALLLPGEEQLIFDERILGRFPREVSIFGQEIKNCFGENGCEMGDSKPILCRLFPEVFAIWQQYSWIILNHPDDSCPVARESELERAEKLAAARKILERILVNPERAQQIIFRGI